jgi:hypothetical protein
VVEVCGLGFLPSVLIYGPSDTTLSLFFISNTLKRDMPIAPEFKNPFDLNTSYSKQLEKIRKMRINTAAVESASAMVASPGGPSVVMTLAPRVALR